MREKINTLVFAAGQIGRIGKHVALIQQDDFGKKKCSKIRAKPKRKTVLLSLREG